MEKSKRRRVARGVILGLILLPGAFVAWEILRPRNDPRIVSGPKELRLIPRSQYQTKPWFSIPWFGGRKLQFPSEGKMPKNWEDNTLASGVLLWDAGSSSPPPAATTSATATPPMQSIFPMAVSSYMTWTGEDGSKPHLPFTYFFNMDIKEYFDVPYVFGIKPITYKLSLAKDPMFAPLSIPDFELKLPATGYPAPKLKPVVVTNGNIELTFTPGNWIGPIFMTDYAVTVKGLKPNQHLFLGGQMDILNAMSADDYEPFTLRLSPGVTSKAMIGREKLSVTAYVVEERAGKVKVVAGSTAMTGVNVVDYKDANGNVLATGYDFTAGTFGPSQGSVQASVQPVENAPVAFKIDGKWIGNAYETEQQSLIQMGVAMSRKPHAKGTYEATFYVPVHKFTIDQPGFRLPKGELEKMIKGAR